MSRPPLLLVGGGTRSGKSTFALARARRMGPRRLFVATAQAGDDEMRSRIQRHQAERGASFDTLEEPLALPTLLRTRTAGYDIVLVDCLTLWLSNVLLRTGSAADVEPHIADLLQALVERTAPILMVTNEVGLGIVPESALGRQFRDLAGVAHQRLSKEADEVYFAVLGTVLRLKPSLAAVDSTEFDA